MSKIMLPRLWVAILGILLVASCESTPATAGQQGPEVRVVQEKVRPAGITPPDKPFLYLPFRKEDASGMKITSDWVTAQDEMGIIHSEKHKALDFEDVKCGKRGPVVAMADGWAVATFQSGVLRGVPDEEAPLNTLWVDPITGRQGYLGYAGLIVDVVFDATDATGAPYRAQYFHLGSFEPHITWLKPQRKPDVITVDGKNAAVWTPPSLSDPATKRTRFKAGDIIGYMGDTGINFGYDDILDPETGIVQPRDRAAQPGWDPQGIGVTVAPEDACQLHLEVFTRDPSGRKLHFDALDLYAQTTGTPGQADYVNHANPEAGVFQVGPRPAFKHTNGRLLFAV